MRSDSVRVAGSSWTTLAGYIDDLMRVSKLYDMCGLVREAEHYLTRALELATKLAATGPLLR